MSYPAPGEWVRCAECGGVSGGLRLAGDVFVHSNPEQCEYARVMRAAEDAYVASGGMKPGGGRLGL
jgi:hypothetical protein